MFRATILSILWLCLMTTVIVELPADNAPLVQALADSVRAHYYLADTGAQVADALLAHLRGGEYDAISDPQALSLRLRDDMFAVAKDRHLNVRYDPGIVADIRASESADPAEVERFHREYLEEERSANFGFTEARIMKGNVGYLRIDRFAKSSEAFPTAVAAMNFLAGSRALIFDLRGNGGGSPDMVQFILSYLTPVFKPAHLIDLVTNDPNMARQSWTLPYVPGPRLDDVPVYVLTGSRTFSAAEQFTYNLQVSDRATVVGVKTRGGAHPAAAFVLNDDIFVTIPMCSAVSPLTGTNWEGCGITPDVPVEEGKALDTAYRMVLEGLLAEEKDDAKRANLQWALDGLTLKESPCELKPAQMRTYAGVYGPCAVTCRKGRLYYKCTGPEMEMLPLRTDVFALDGQDDFRLRFERDDSGRVITLVGMYQDGHEDISPKTD